VRQRWHGRAVAVSSNLLGYQSAGRRRRRRYVALLTAGTFVAVISAMWLHWRSRVLLGYETWRAQRDCLNYTAAPDRSPSGVPACWQYFYPALPGDPPVAFMHERVTPSGKRRLVVVQLEFEDRTNVLSSPPATAFVISSLPSCGIDTVRVHVFEIKSPWPAVIGLGNSSKFAGRVGISVGPLGHFHSGFNLGTAESLAPHLQDSQLYNGQPDPLDSSHFTIGYYFEGKGGTIDGWLRDNDDVELSVRGRPEKY
jgi:hypothetical protein